MPAECEHGRAVPIATHARLCAPHGRWVRGDVEWCPDCGAIRGYGPEVGAGQLWCAPGSGVTESRLAELAASEQRRLSATSTRSERHGVRDVG